MRDAGRPLVVVLGVDINNMQCDQRVALAGLRTEGEIQDKVLTEAGNHQLLQHCLCVQSLLFP